MRTSAAAAARIRCYFQSFEQRRFQRDLGAKVGANSPRPQATPGHRQRSLMQLIGALSDTRQRAAMLRRCLLSSESRTRILPGAQQNEIVTGYVCFSTHGVGSQRLAGVIVAYGIGIPTRISC